MAIEGRNRSYTGPAWPVTRALDRKREHDDLLFEIESARNGSAIRLREKYAALIDEIRRDDTLSEKGQKQKIAALVRALGQDDDFVRYQVKIKRAEERAKTLRARLTKQDQPNDKGMSAKEMRHELQRHRIISDFKAHTPAERQRIVRTALDVSDVAFLSVVASEPGLIDAETGRRIDALMMRNADAEGMDELTELLGPVDFKGEHQAERGALPLAKLALDSLASWLREQADWQPSLSELLEQRGLPQAVVDDSTILLSRTAAKDAQIWRAAAAEAEASGKQLAVESPETNGAA